MSLNSFNRIAPYYDRLAALAFGKSIRKSQTHFLDQIPLRATVLVIGGGTGWWLKELQEKNPECTIWFIEASSEMLSRAIQNNAGKLISIHGTEEAIPEMQFDAIITYFFLDLFDEPELNKMVTKLASSLRDDGVWLISDFVNHTYWHRAALFVMYNFFWFLGAVRIKKLANWEKILLDKNLEPIHQKYFFRRFILSGIYQKANSQ